MMYEWALRNAGKCGTSIPAVYKCKHYIKIPINLIYAGQVVV